MDKRDLVALIIWWCEGTKLRRDKRWKSAYIYSIEVINSDHKIIKIFADFLRKRLKVTEDKIKWQVQIHEGDNKDDIENFWIREIGLTRKQQNKTIIRKIGNKPGKNKGTFKLRIHDKELFLRIKSMLDKQLKEIFAGE